MVEESQNLAINVRGSASEFDARLFIEFLHGEVLSPDIKVGLYSDVFPFCQGF